MESVIDNESLVLFIDNKDVCVLIENVVYGLRVYLNIFNYYDLWGCFVCFGYKKFLVEEVLKKIIVICRILEKVDGIFYDGEIKIIFVVVSICKDGEDVEYFVWLFDWEEKVEWVLICLVFKGKIVKINFKLGI